MIKNFFAPLHFFHLIYQQSRENQTLMYEKSDLWGALGFGGGGGFQKFWSVRGVPHPPLLEETAKITLKICENILILIPFH